MTHRLPDLFPGFESKRFLTRDAQIFARVGGTGPTIFLLHGYPQTHAMWHRIAPELAERFTLVIPDLRGYGDSSIPADTDGHVSFSKRAMGDDICDIANELGQDRFMVCGHDRGGRVAYRLALDEPARVSKLAVLDIVPTYDMWHKLTPALAAKVFHWMFLAQKPPLPETMIAADPVAWLEGRMAAWTASQTLDAFAPEAIAHYRAFFCQPARLHATCEDYRAGATCDLHADEADRAAGRKISCPTLALWGASGIPQQSDSPLDVWRGWCSDVQGRSIGCGHFLAEEAPGETRDELLRFFGK